MIQVKVTGMDEIKREMKRVVKEMEGELQMGTNEAAERVASMLKANAPRGPTGNLARSPATKPLPPRHGYPQVTIVGCDYQIAPHQHLVEFGSVRSRANPFFRRTIDGARSAIRSVIRSRAENPIKRRGG